MAELTPVLIHVYTIEIHSFNLHNIAFTEVEFGAFNSLSSRPFFVEDSTNAR